MKPNPNMVHFEGSNLKFQVSYMKKYLLMELFFSFL